MLVMALRESWRPVVPLDTAPKRQGPLWGGVPLVLNSGVPTHADDDEGRR
jgi:hypothetical protein